MQCQFCKIIGGLASAEVLHRNEHAIAILDINPIHYGHALVMPVSHYATFLEVPDEELHGLIKITKIVSQAIVAICQPAGFNIFSNNGKAAGQSVFHFHFHVTPRYADDNIRFILKLKKYQENEMSSYASLLRQHIDANSSIEEIK